MKLHNHFVIRECWLLDLLNACVFSLYIYLIYVILCAPGNKLEKVWFQFDVCQMQTAFWQVLYVPIVLRFLSHGKLNEDYQSVLQIFLAVWSNLLSATLPIAATSAWNGRTVISKVSKDIVFFRVSATGVSPAVGDHPARFLLSCLRTPSTGAVPACSLYCWPKLIVPTCCQLASWKLGLILGIYILTSGRTLGQASPQVR